MSHTVGWPWPAATLIVALGAVVLPHVPALTRSQGQMARYEIQLRYEKISGSHGGPDSCPKAKRNGSDVMTGIVQGDESGGEITYKGDLSRSTTLEYCEVWRPNGSEDEFCVPVLTGKQARVTTVIDVYPPRTNQDTQIKYAPMISNTDSADVKGACTGEMELDIVQGYLESEGFTIITTNQPAMPRLIEKVTWQDVKPRPVTGPDGWTLTVLRKLQ
jgi:hypothetical protein